MKTLLLLLTFLLGLPAAASAAPAPPNIVVFLADDMGWGDAGCYGSKLIKTPNLDKLASQGVRFTQFYAPCGVCSPSRSAILTGRTPYRNGVWRHLSGNHETHLRASEVTYPKLLQKAGYQTCHVGKWHLNSKQQFNKPDYPQPGDHGYDYWMATHNNAEPSHKNPRNFVRNGKPVGELQGFSARLVASEAIHWLEKIRDPRKPFALSIWVHEPHKPIATDQQFSSQYGDHRNRTYMGNITQLDFALGEVMDTLDKKGLAANTLFIFTSDNGPEGQGGPTGGSTGGLRGRKRDDFEGGIRVPGIVRWPGRIKPGTVSNVPVIGTDIFATVLDVTGTAMPTDRTIDGVSMLPATAGNPVQRKTPLFWRTHVSRPDCRVALRIDDWKIVSNETMTTFKLFQIENDPQEQHDLAASNADKLTQMKKSLFRVWAEIEADGPKEWWRNPKLKPRRGSKVAY